MSVFKQLPFFVRLRGIFPRRRIFFAPLWDKQSQSAGRLPRRGIFRHRVRNMSVFKQLPFFVRLRGIFPRRRIFFAPLWDKQSQSAGRKFVEDEHGRVDYFNLNLVQSVEKGGVICQAVPPKEGVPGRTVLNQEIPCKTGKTAALPKGRNTEASEDGTKLLAMKSGRVEFSGRGFMVKSVLEINGNVDFSSGNINFVGDVHIHGDVSSGFSIRTIGDVTIEIGRAHV